MAYVVLASIVISRLGDALGLKCDCQLAMTFIFARNKPLLAALFTLPSPSHAQRSPTEQMRGYGTHELASDFVLPRQNRRERLAQNSYNQGAWSKDERLLLLQGLRKFGPGKWKEIGLFVKTRYVWVVN